MLEVGAALGKADEGVSVGMRFAGLGVAHGEVVAGEFTVGAETVEGVPDGWVETVEYLQRYDEPVDGDVPPFYVGELVEEDVAKGVGRQGGHHAGRQ